MDAAFGRLTELEPPKHRPEDYDLVVFGSTVWVPGATQLFEASDALEQVAHSAARWFVRHLGARTLKATA
jgi:hypothetical protein